MAYCKIERDNSYNSTPNPWQLKWVFRVLSVNKSREVLKQCKLHYREYPFSAECFIVNNYFEKLCNLKSSVI